MKKLTIYVTVLIFILTFSTVSVMAKKNDIAGIWNGTTATPDGQELEVTMTINKAKNGYSGSVSDTSGLLQDIALNDIKLKGNDVTCNFILAMGETETTITIELKIDGDKMTGTWYKEDDGSTGDFVFTREKKEKK